MRTVRLLGLGLVLGLASLSGCSKKTEGGAHLKDVESAFGKEGWKIDAFQATDAQRFSAQKCVAGAIEGLDAVVCEFGSDEAVQRGKKAAEGWVGAAVTGVALDKGRTVLALADRSRVDPNGKLVHRISKTYRDIK
jgi:hypothetical protein